MCLSGGSCQLGMSGCDSVSSHQDTFARHFGKSVVKPATRTLTTYGGMAIPVVWQATLPQSSTAVCQNFHSRSTLLDGCQSNGRRLVLQVFQVVEGRGSEMSLRQVNVEESKQSSLFSGLGARGQWVHAPSNDETGSGSSTATFATLAAIDSGGGICRVEPDDRGGYH